MRIAALVKQVPQLVELELGPDGRLRREDVDVEMNAFCRRAVAQAVQIARLRSGVRVTVITLGGATADDVLRESIVWGLDRAVEIDGVHVSDPAFRGSDTLATARALAATIRREGGFDLVMTGRNSVDADTGQVGPQLAEMLGLPFLSSVRELTVDNDRVRARCEHDDGSLVAEVDLPVVLSAAERLIEPTKVSPRDRSGAPSERIRRVTAADLGEGPWGEAGSATAVGRIRVMGHDRLQQRDADAPLDEQVRQAVRVILDRGALDLADGTVPSVPSAGGRVLGERSVGVVAEPDRPSLTRELLGSAARLAREVDAHVVTCVLRGQDVTTLASWGSDRTLVLGIDNVEEDVAGALSEWANTAQPWAILAGSTSWGREVASRVAARLGAGLVGDAVELEVRDDRLVAWKPAFGGQLVAAVTSLSPIQVVTVRYGVLPTLTPRDADPLCAVSVPATPRSRVQILARTRDSDVGALADATAVIGVGMGVPPAEYSIIEPLRTALRAELGATRKVTDAGWLPHSRQIGITGRAISPRLFVSIGASGRFNHMIGVRAADTVVAINSDRDAPVFDAADVGIVADWREAVQRLAAVLARVSGV